MNRIAAYSTAALLLLAATAADNPSPACDVTLRPAWAQLDTIPNKCCKICRKGKACGDTCIAKDKTCHKGKGCACNAEV